jgi:hypothetical protein
MPATNYQRNLFLNYAFGAKTTFASSTIYWGLSTALLTSDCTGTTAYESTAATYARKSMLNNTDNWTASEYPVYPVSNNFQYIENKLDLIFVTSGANSWGVMRTIFIADSGTTGAGNILWYDYLSPALTVEANTIPTFPAGSLMVSMV